MSPFSDIFYSALLTVILFCSVWFVHQSEASNSFMLKLHETITKVCYRPYSWRLFTTLLLLHTHSAFTTFFSLFQPSIHLESVPAEYFRLVLVLIEDYSHSFYCILCLISIRHKHLNEGSRQARILVYNFFPDTSLNPFIVLLIFWTTTCLAWIAQTYLCK